MKRFGRIVVCFIATFGLWASVELRAQVGNQAPASSVPTKQAGAVTNNTVTNSTATNGAPVATPNSTTPTSATSSQFGEPVATKGSQLGKLQTSRYQIGLTLQALGGPCVGLYGTAPVPIDWPEQSVQVLKEEFTPTVQKIDYRMINGTVKQMLVYMPLVPPGVETKALVTLEIRRYSLLPPADTSMFVLPNDKKLPREMKQYLLPSPQIESTHTRIRAIAREIMTANADANAWTKVEAIYDWVRSKVTYVNGPLKGALQSLQDGSGDCEELSSLFIAICRAAGVPARIVWVPDHCYPEFYLEDGEGKGYWFPCQAAGTKEFGGITEHRPILQKGDNFLVPELPTKRQRYVAEYLTGKGGNPKVRFIRQLLETVDAAPPGVLPAETKPVN